MTHYVNSPTLTILLADRGWKRWVCLDVLQSWSWRVLKSYNVSECGHYYLAVMNMTFICYDVWTHFWFASKCCSSIVVACLDLYNGFVNEDVIELTGGFGMYGILVLGTTMKLVLYIYCSRMNTVLKLDTLDALAEDHLNDVSHRRHRCRYCSTEWIIRVFCILRSKRLQQHWVVSYLIYLVLSWLFLVTAGDQ